MATIHISEAEAASDFAGLMARVRAGEEIVIESDNRPVAVIRASDLQHPSAEDDLGLTAEIDRVEGLIENPHQENEAQPSLDSKQALDRAATFLLSQSARLKTMCGLPAPVPDIDLGPAGSIDIHWKRGDWELLVNIPAATGELAAFYGDNGSQKIKGSFDPKTFNYGIATWLMND